MKNFTAAILLAIGAYAGDYANQPHPSHQPYTGGDLHSKDTFLYGRFVAMMKSSQAKGTHTQFFLYELEDGKEITNDIFDEGNSINYIPKRGHAPVITKMNRAVGSNSHWMEHPDIDLDDDEFHKYTIEWTPQYISYSIDHTELFRHNQVQSQSYAPQNLWITFLTYADKQGLYEHAEDIIVEDLPFWTEVEYVEVYNYNQSDESFNLSFRDDFQSYDENRWASLDNKTWLGMSSTFMEDNHEVEHGRLYLKVHRADAEESDDDSDEESSSDDGDFHVLPPPRSGTLDQAIEKATRVGVTMIRTYLEDFSENMGAMYCQPMDYGH